MEVKVSSSALKSLFVIKEFLMSRGPKTLRDLGLSKAASPKKQGQKDNTANQISRRSGDNQDQTRDEVFQLEEVLESRTLSVVVVLVVTMASSGSHRMKF